MPATTDTIALECPSCSEELEIDIGFAGGVCRCSNCGTLMTVPADPQAQRAESVTRPERPDAPPGAQPQAPAQAPTTDTPARPEAPTQPPPTDQLLQSPINAAADQLAAAQRDNADCDALAAAARPAIDTYVTATGRTIQVSAAVEIPVATKRRVVVQASVVLVFVIICAALAAVVGGAAMLVTTGDEDAAPPPPELGYAPDVNPFTLRQPNVLGVPLTGNAAIVLDTSRQTQRWLALATDAIVAGITHATARDQCVIVVAGDAVTTIPPEPAPLDNQTRKQIATALANLYSEGAPDLLAALQLATTVKPKQIVLLAGQPLDNDVDALRDLMDANKAVRFDVILIAQDPPALRQYIIKRGGAYVILTRWQINQWQKQARPDDSEPTE